MKPTDFSRYLSEFLGDYLPFQKRYSQNTVKSYRDTFRLLLRFMNEKEGLAPEKIHMKTLTPARIKAFISWLEEEKKCSVQTCNLRLSAIHSFFRYCQMESPESLYDYQQILAIPVKKARKRLIDHLSLEGMKVFLQQPDPDTEAGRKHLTLLSLMYDSGARVSEMTGLSVKDYLPGKNPCVVVTGKGNKTRKIPIMKETADLLDRYLRENRLDNPLKKDWPLFTNRQHTRLTKEGVAYIVNKYGKMAHEVSPEVPRKVTCHMLRHSKAYHLLEAGINIIYIRDFLGHESVKTTEVYARTSEEVKRRELEKAAKSLVETDLPDWNQDKDLMDFLNSL